MRNLLKPYLKYRYLLYFFSFVAGWPCVFFLLGWLPHYTVNYIILFLLVFLFILAKGKSKIPPPIIVLIFFQISIWGLYYLLHGFDSSYLTRIFILATTIVLLEMQMTGDRQGFMKLYNFWLVFQVIAGTLGVVLVLLGILEPLFEFKELDMRPGYFFGLFTTNTYFDGLIRNAGFFDEPGSLAFWGVYALLINKLFVNNRKVEGLLIFGLISTLSLAYFIQLAMYVFFFYKEKRKKILPYIFVFIVLLYWLSSSNEMMSKAIFGRMEYDAATGTISGDNRSDLAEVCWDVFTESPVIGHGGQNLIDLSQKREIFIAANPFFPLAVDGIVGTFVLLVPFFYFISLRRFDKNYQWAFWILLAGFMQRPYDSNQLLYPLMSYTIILHAYLHARRVKFLYYKSRKPSPVF